MRMRRACLSSALAGLLLAAAAGWLAVEVWDRLDRLVDGEGDGTVRAAETAAASPSTSGTAVEPTATEAGDRGGFTVVRRTGPVRSRAPRSDDVALARAAMAGSGVERRCGPYRLYTDVGDDAPGERLIAACGRLAAGLEAEYVRLFGVQPIGEPAEAILLFRDRVGLRRFVGAVAERSGRPRLTGYAGHASAARGYVALHAVASAPTATLRTLLHELTHLLNRRAIGPELPRWLSEGMADAIGDRATEEGLLPFAGVRGSEGEAERLRLALGAARVGSVGRLLALEPGEFDRGTVSYDYEQSAILVRFLLDEPDLAPRFRAALVRLAAGEEYDDSAFLARLGVGPDELDRRFRNWVRSGATAGG